MYPYSLHNVLLMKKQNQDKLTKWNQVTQLGLVPKKVLAKMMKRIHLVCKINKLNEQFSEQLQAIKKLFKKYYHYKSNE